VRAAEVDEGVKEKAAEKREVRVENKSLIVANDGSISVTIFDTILTRPGLTVIAVSPYFSVPLNHLPSDVFAHNTREF
jgi:hypothetical protein